MKQTIYCIAFVITTLAFAQKPPAPESAAQSQPAPDLTKQPTLYAVAYAHLDTQWRWEYPETISEYLTKTMRNNFVLFERYPHYIFNFTGANRYRLMKEYFPDDFAKLKEYVAAGRWFPAGSSMEEGDVNTPSAESILRQVLYGNSWFRKEFGKASAEFMLPDCFGFPASLPTILAQAGIKGFSTQKLSVSWQPAPHVGGPDSPEKTPEGIPFNVGIWEGPDGRTVIAALNPLSYDSNVNYDLSKAPPMIPPVPANAPPNFHPTPLEDWPKRIQIDGQLTGIFADYHYFGTGDIGGSPEEDSVRLVEAMQTRSETDLHPIRYYLQKEMNAPPSTPVKVGNGPINVIYSNADQMFLDILKCCTTDRLPRFKGDLELISHSAGSLTSQAYHKRWNRKNEILADAAEKASVAAEWLSARTYPQKRLNDAWTLVMGGQFHDILAGTATPKAYEFSWNDDVIAMNQFAGVLTSATQAIASGLDTSVNGIPIAVYNQLEVSREDLVEATSPSLAAATSVRVVGPDGNAVPAQLERGADGSAKVVFLAKVPPVGYSVFDLQAGQGSMAFASDLHVSENALENARYRVQIDQNGDTFSIFDKKLNRELLAAPIRLAISTDNPLHWPAWNMDFEDEQRPPRAFVSGPARVRVTENGPARVAVEIVREAEGSTFIQTVRLSAGDAGNRVEFLNGIDWNTKEANLKAVFPLTAANKMATYNWDVGTIQRPTEDERQFEVASHQWIDLTDQSSPFGATLLTDMKNGSDKREDNTIRLTLIRTPGTRGGYSDQGTQDLGHHEILFGIAGHGADWRADGTDWQAYRLNEPLVGFETTKQKGLLGKQFSVARISSNRVRVLALKKAELTDEIILRLVELDGKPQQNVKMTFAAPITSAREVNGQEQPVGAATVANGTLVASFGAFQPRTFALRLAAPAAHLEASQWRPVKFGYELSVATLHGHTDGSFDIALNSPTVSQGKALPAEALPRDIEFAGIHFELAPAGIGRANAATAHGQSIALPAGNFNRIYLLAAARGGDQRAIFHVKDRPVAVNIQEWTGYVGQWDSRAWRPHEEAMQPAAGTASRPGEPRIRLNPYGDVIEIVPGFIKTADIAWYDSHRHNSDGSAEPYQYSYLFAYPIDLPMGATTVTLPNDDRIRILAITVAKEHGTVRPVQPLYDVSERASH